MQTGMMPTATVYGTWLEHVELSSIDDGGLVDLSTVTEIRLQLLDPLTRSVFMTLTKTNGDITIPSPGIIQWRVEKGQMGTMPAKIYDMLLTLEDETDTVPLILGPVAIVE